VTVAGILLAPGAGATRASPALVAVEAAVAPLPVVRMDFPYRKAGRKAPDKAPVLVRSVVEEAEALARSLRVGTEALVLGGRSMGGRMCSMAVAEGLPAAGLVLVAYPLHPPGRPEKLRTEHLPDVRVPCLFVSGTRDPFGSPDELAAALEQVGGPVTVHLVEGAGHDLKRADAAVAAVVADWVARLG
jgi:predicted alpha/beta-hydrolase family hydrolase